MSAVLEPEDETGRGMLAPLRTTPLAVLDVGSGRIACFLARPRPSHGFVLLGRGFQQAAGIRAGVPHEVGAATAAIAATLQEAEEAAGEEIRGVVLVTSAGRPRSRLVRVELEVAGGVVREAHLRSALEEARRIALKPGEVALHAVPVEGVVDGGKALRDPRGARGARLDLLATVVVADAPAIDTLLDAVGACHLEVLEVMAAPYAAGVAVASEDEMERGVLVAEFGAGTTGLAHFHDGRLLFVHTVPWGGRHLTADLAYGLATSPRIAERLKTLHGSLDAADGDLRLEVPGASGGEVETTIARADLARILRARVEEIFDFLREGIEAQRDLFDGRPPRSVVLSGGGSELDGLDRLAEEVFGLPVRRGRAGLVHGREGIEDDPTFAAASGALALAAGDDGGLSWHDMNRAEGGGWLARLTRWLGRR